MVNASRGVVTLEIPELHFWFDFVLISNYFHPFFFFFNNEAFRGCVTALWALEPSLAELAPKYTRNINSTLPVNMN